MNKKNVVVGLKKLLLEGRLHDEAGLNRMIFRNEKLNAKKSSLVRKNVDIFYQSILKGVLP